MFETLAEPEPEIELISPPLRNFFTKKVDYKGLPIMASNVVSDRALIVAHKYISDMLCEMPQVLQNLMHLQAEFHIIGRHQKTSDLPENKHRKGRKFREFGRKWTIDTRTRGVGGLFSSCGEENLLQLSRDRYEGLNICVHEFAHTIMNFGCDDAIRALIKKQFRASRRKQLWSGTYAATNSMEFFAELSSWYFGGRGNGGRLVPQPKAGRAWLSQYDPQAYDLIHKIYCGQLQPEAAHLLKARLKEADFVVSRV